MEHYEYSEKKGECTYGLVMQSCRRCLFENLCHYQKMQEENKKKSDLSNKKD